MIKGRYHVNMDLKGFTKKALKEIDNALVYTGYRIINDVDNVGPMVPIDEGTLVGSSYVSVQGVDGLFNENYSSGEATGANITPDTAGLKSQSMRISYNTAYAERVHEKYDTMIPGQDSQQKFGIVTDRPQGKDGYGYKFLERTYKQNEIKYRDLFIEFLEEGIARAGG